MSSPNFEYATLPTYNYQTFDRETLAFTKVPVTSLYSKSANSGSDEPNADTESNKDVALDEPPQEAPPEESQATVESPPAETPTGESIYQYPLLLGSMSRFLKSQGYICSSDDR